MTSAWLNKVRDALPTAAAETCPFWPGHPTSAHWGIPDPAAVQGTPDQIARAFREAFLTLDRRIDLLLALPDTALHSLAVQPLLDQIGRS